MSTMRNTVVSFDNHCGEAVMRKDMEDHMNDVCSKRVVVCAYMQR